MDIFGWVFSGSSETFLVDLMKVFISVKSFGHLSRSMVGRGAEANASAYPPVSGPRKHYVTSAPFGCTPPSNAKRKNSTRWVKTSSWKFRSGLLEQREVGVSGWVFDDIWSLLRAFLRIVKGFLGSKVRTFTGSKCWSLQQPTVHVCSLITATEF